MESLDIFIKNYLEWFLTILTISLVFHAESYKPNILNLKKKKKKKKGRRSGRRRSLSLYIFNF